MQSLLKTQNILKILSILRLLSFISAFYNIFGATIFNGLGLFSLKTYAALEIFKQAHQENIEQFFHQIADFEVYNSLGNFYAHHPHFIFPKIEKDEKISAENLKHPFISNAKGADFELKKGQIILLTGANMSGKSTFLKTLGINIILSKMGLPLAAENFSVYPFDVQTFMQNTDDLHNQTSYFLAEILQLKAILTQIEAKKTVFILLDEILKGTNSKDKLKGSQAFLEKLIAKNTTGVFASHDLALTALAQKYPDQILNFHFAGEIIAQDVHFDYMLKTGVCSDTNAYFLMQKYGIV